MMNQMASQQQQQQQIPVPPIMPNGAGAAIYATATCSPNTSSSVNPTIYAGQQHMMLPPGGGLPGPGQQQQLPNNYGQTNGGSAYGGQPQYGIPPAPQMPMQQMQLIQQQQQPPPQMQQVNAPPQAPPPPMPPAFPIMTSANVPQPPAPPLPPATGGGGGAAPPPPPPPPGAGMLGGKGDAGINSLALQLATAKLKRSQPPKTAPPAPVSTVTENSGSSTSSGGSGRSSSGMASMMDEMAKTLARRRAQVEKKEPDPTDDGQSNSGRQRAWEKSSTLPHKLSSSSSNQNNNSATSNNTSLSGSESPKPSRKRFGSASEETILKQINGDSFSLPSSMELESFKEDILREMRCEIAKAKQEIIEAIKSEFNRR